MSVFSSPKPPKQESPPPVDETADATEAEERRRKRQRQGLSSTLLAPVGQDLAETQPKTLFGIS